jgi:hypothetical protein
MDDKESKILSFQVTVEELAIIDARAAKAGANRSEYLRTRALSEPVAAPSDELRDLIRYGIYLETQIYNGMFSIAEGQGKVKRFLSNEELKGISQRVRRDTVQYAVGFDEHFKAVAAELDAARRTAKPVKE